jgi:2-hydroxychromene-2-carboxylate isomerase
VTADFVYDFNSPYAYLAAQRVDDVLPVEVRWRPIAFGVLIGRIGKVPWSLSGPETVAEGKRECERRAAELGLPPLVWPDGWPAENYSIGVLRAALVAERHALLKAFSLAAYRQGFVHGRQLRDPDVLALAAGEAGLDAGALREGIQDPEIKDELRTRTDAAIAEGITGIPTIVLDSGETFWGDDRLEDAARAAGGR